MKRIVTHLLVAAGLAVGVVGIAQAHTDLNIGLSLGAPAYAAPIYGRSAPEYRSPRAVWPHRYDQRWGSEHGYWNHSDWNRGGDHRGGWNDRRG